MADSGCAKLTQKNNEGNTAAKVNWVRFRFMNPKEEGIRDAKVLVADKFLWIYGGLKKWDREINEKEREAISAALVKFEGLVSVFRFSRVYGDISAIISAGGNRGFEAEDADAREFEWVF
ncbi:MAG: hypothetical protein ABIH99_05420 [Candidatus Micrarchaeota archaeon]